MDERVSPNPANTSFRLLMGLKNLRKIDRGLYIIEKLIRKLY